MNDSNQPVQPPPNLATSDPTLDSRLAAIVESSDDAIVSKSLQGIIRTWNKGAERIFGWKSEEVVGKAINIIIPPDRQHEEPQILARLARGERVDHFETVRMTKEGRRIDVSVTISPIRDASGKVVGASKIARDITLQKRFQQELQKAKEVAEQARVEAEHVSLMKDEFLATLSHELRTPLNAILGWAQVLQAQAGTDQVLGEGLTVIERNARVQAQLIEDLLDMSRIVAGKIRLDVQQVDLQDAVNAAVASVRHAADAKQIRLQVVLDPLAGPVRGDPARLQQCFWNLLTNAIKFTPKGGQVQVTLERVNSHAEVCVADNGQGIKPEFLPYLFERFRQADSSTSRRHGGLGLGLSIVKHLIELHGGRVRAKSAGEGQGATFCIELPISLVRPSETKARRADPQDEAAGMPAPDRPSHVVTSASAAVKAACAAAAAGGSAAGIGAGAGTSIAKGAIKMMTWTKTQLAAGVLVAATIGGAGGTLAIKTALAQGQAGGPANHPAANKAAAPVQLDKAANNGIVSVATSAPVVVATVPQAGATDVDAASTTEIKVGFSKPMEPGNFSWVRFGKDTFPETAGKPHFLDDHRTCVLPVKLQPGHPYVIWLNKAPYDSFMDTDGHKAVPYLLVFETRQ